MKKCHGAQEHNENNEKKRGPVSDDFGLRSPRQSENRFRQKAVYLNTSIVARVSSLSSHHSQKAKGRTFTVSCVL